MTNEHIEVVKRWQAGEEVSQTELEDNAEAAHALWAASDAAHAAAYAAAHASAASYADRLVKRYEELTNEK
tara:strand:+ start:478 stop:690 length:213 start_codon:yes stop_codon:yes gene_type:complete